NSEASLRRFPTASDASDCRLVISTRVVQHPVKLEPCHEQIEGGDECSNLPIDHAPLQHPEPAVRMHIRQTIRSNGFHDAVDPRGDELRTLHLVVLDVDDADAKLDPARSEEHTSELQSRVDLVCRLLLEK